MKRSIDTIIAQALKISPEEVTGDLEYGAIESWDSLGHVSLMLQIESEYAVEIDEDTMIELTSVQAIKAYVGQVAS
jgi:acyl carrier protein